MKVDRSKCLTGDASILDVVVEEPWSVFADGDDDDGVAKKVGVNLVEGVVEHIRYVVFLREDVEDLSLPRMLLDDAPSGLNDTKEFLVEEAKSVLLGEDSLELHRASHGDTDGFTKEVDRVVRDFRAREVLYLHLRSQELGVEERRDNFERHNLGPNRGSTGVGRVEDFLSGGGERDARLGHEALEAVGEVYSFRATRVDTVG